MTIHQSVPISRGEMATEKFCLKWNDFQQNVAESFGGLRKAPDFSDVTLATEGNQHIKAHKVLLASASPLFKELLLGNTHSHPLIYMRGLQHRILAAVVDFIYLGETEVEQEEMEGFLALAEELQLRGLTREAVGATWEERGVEAGWAGEEKNEEKSEESNVNQPRAKSRTKKPKTQQERTDCKDESSEILESIMKETLAFETHNMNAEFATKQTPTLETHQAHDQGSRYSIQGREFYDSYNKAPTENTPNGSDDITFAMVTTDQPKYHVDLENADFSDLAEKLESMLEKIDGKWSCKVCGKTTNSNKKKDVRRHAEKHLSGVSHPCTSCEKTFKSSESLRKHKYLDHTSY